jgi:hypothetical protein
MIQLQQGATYSDNRRDVSEATFEADAVAVAIWNMLRTKPDGFARCSKRSTITPPKPRGVAHRLVIPRGTTSPAFPVSVLRADRLRERSASRDGEAPGSNGAEFRTTIGEA